MKAGITSKKQVVLLIAAAMALLGLTGCGKKANESATNNNNSGNSVIIDQNESDNGNSDIMADNSSEGDNILDLEYTSLDILDYTYDIRTNGVKIMGTKLRDDKASLTQLIIPNEINGVSVTAIEGFGNGYYKNLEEVYLPDSVVCVDTDTFEETKWLEAHADDEMIFAGKVLYKYQGNEKNVTVPEGTVGIAGAAFYESGITEVSLPDSVEYIGIWAFADCTSLTSVDINEGLKYIDGYAFNGCTALSDITFPESLEMLGSKSFANTPWLSNQTDDFIIVNNILYSCKISGKTIAVPDGVTALGSYVFANKSSVEEIILPDSLKVIGEGAFSGSSVVSIQLPDALTTIQDDAFSDCKKLENLTIPNSVTQIGGSFVGGGAKLKTLELPDALEFIGYQVEFDYPKNELVYQGKSYGYSESGIAYQMDSGLYNAVNEFEWVRN